MDKPKYTPVEMRTLVEVVKCKECAIRYTSCPMVFRMGMIGVVAFYTEDDDYCSHGRRK